MKNLRLLALVPALIMATSLYAATDPCEGDAEVTCSKALVIAKMFAKRNISDFGTGARHVYKGVLHTIDSKGLERKEAAIGKTMWTNHPEVRMRGLTDKELYVTASTYYGGGVNDDAGNFDPSKMEFSFSMVVGKFFGFGSLNYSDPNLKAKVDHLGGDRFSQWAFTDIEASDVQIENLAGVGNDVGTLKHISMKMVEKPTIIDLMEASVVPSFALHQGSKLLDSWDLDLQEAKQKHELVHGSIGSRLQAKGMLTIFRRDTPTGELPAHCRRKDTAQVAWEASIDIPGIDLAKTSVIKMKTEVVKCW